MFKFTLALTTFTFEMYVQSKLLRSFFDFDVYYDSTTQEVVFTTWQPNNSWFGILLNSATMNNCDAIAFQAANQYSKAKDYYATSFM